MNLLIVDDTPTDLKLLRAQLEAEGHAVFEAHDGVDALALLERQRVDVVISDILMPRMDGYRLCHEIRKHARLHDLPIILYTSSFTSPSDEKLALDVGADKYLKKPASVETIITAVHEVIAKPHAAPRPEALQEIEVLKEYSGRLVSTLVGKTTELMAAEVKFRALVEQSIVGIYIIQDDQFVYVNPRMAGIFGRSEEEMTSRTVYDFVVPEDHALACENIRKRISGGVPSIHYHLRMLHQSGAVLQVEVHSSRADYNGRPAVMGTLLDITDRKRAEEALRESERKYRLLVANAHEAIFIAQDNVVKFPNPKALEMTGYSMEELAGVPFTDLIHPKDRGWVIERYNDRLQGGTPSETYPFRIIGKTGEEIWVQLTANLVDWEGRPGVLCFLKDITKERNQDAQLQQAMKMEAVGRLAGGVAHDFNNLLTVITGYSELLLQKIGKESPMHGEVEEIKRAGERAALLTQQLLAFSRKQIIEPKVVHLDSLVAEMHKMLTRLIGEDIALQAITGKSLGSVKVDPGQFQQILMNLVVNARDAMPDGGKIVIETSNADLDEGYCAIHPYVKPGRFVMLSVSDTGKGMSEEVKVHIFEPFFTTKEQGSGTGLGLATAYGIVKQAGGSIEVYSEVGIGTTFKIYLPRVEEEAVKPVKDDRPMVLAGGTETVLIVEDEGILGNLCVQILEPLGYRVLQARNGTEAIAEVQGYGDRIDLLLTDVVMPGMNGSELAKQLVLHNPEMKVLFTSGYTEDVISHHGVLAEGVSFIGKPYTPLALTRKIREVLDKA